MEAIDPDYIMAALEEIATQTDRGSAIIGAAIVDDVLTDLLKRRLILNKAQEERLFNYDNSPLAHFSAKIDMAYSLGLVSPRTRDLLHLIRKIRNRFAHNVRAFKFSDAKVAALCQSLFLIDNAIKQPRNRFLMACAQAVGIVGMIRSKPDIRVTDVSGFTDGPKILTAMSMKLVEMLKKQESEREDGRSDLEAMTKIERLTAELERSKKLLRQAEERGGQTNGAVE